MSSEDTHPAGIDRDALVEIYSASNAHFLMGQLAECRVGGLVHFNALVAQSVIREGYTSAIAPTFVPQLAHFIHTFRRTIEGVVVKPVRALVSTTGLGSVPFTYNMAQSVVVARKRA